MNYHITRAIELANEQRDRRPEFWISVEQRTAFYGSDFEAGISDTINNCLVLAGLMIQEETKK